jgi:hypothetical protein
MSRNQVLLARRRRLSKRRRLARWKPNLPSLGLSASTYWITKADARKWIRAMEKIG